MLNKSIALAGLLAVIGIGVARADTVAYATSATNLRADPSTRSSVIAKIPANAELVVGHCTQGWCFAHLGRRSGYVAESQLDFNDNGGTVVERTYVEPEYVYPDYYPGYYYGPGLYWGGYYGGYRGGWHGGWHGDWHGHPGPWHRR
jgi:uncharacterized protein YraI